MQQPRHLYLGGGRGSGVAAWGEGGGVEYRESVPRGGMPSGNPVAVDLMNFAKATTRGGEDQTGDARSSEGTAWRKRCLAHSRGGHSKTSCVKVSSPEEHLGHVGRTGSLHQSGRWVVK